MRLPRPTARAAVTICAFLAAAAAGCRPAPDTPDIDSTLGATPLPAPPAPSSAASAMADTVPLASLIMWDAAAAQTALLSSGMPPRVIRSELSEAGLPNGIALGVGPAELHIFFFGDIAAADAAYRSLDVRDLRPIAPARGEPVAMINNNMLVIVFGGDAALRRRLVEALRPGADNLAREQVEP